jgi:hypothetical protein
MLKIIIGLVLFAIIGVGGGLAALYYLGSLEEPPPFVDNILNRGQVTTEVIDEGPFFYNVQSWFEFTTPAGLETLGDQHIDLDRGLQFTPPAGMVQLSPDDIDARDADRPNSRLRMTDASFDTAAIVWFFETEDGQTTVTVRATPSPQVITELEFEQLFTQYRATTLELFETMGVEDYRIEAAFFGGGLGIYTKFASPEPEQQVIHMLQVVGRPDEDMVTITFARPVDGLPLEWESIVQASMETISTPGELIQ